ncbi:MAG: type IV pilus assembly protein PilC [Desulfobacteraceae bacterium Eth-SRB2]|nr:MAG: type IV pilus assembly protein PilC [Desulfobacteraceae bacterium Eth-SRB2]
MPQFAYKATDARGQIVSGRRVANNQQELTARLHQSGLELLRAKPVSSKPIFASLQALQLGRVSRVELIEFSNNMGVMLKSGVPLIDALSELREDQANRYFRNILDNIIEQIQGGDLLNKALKKHPRAFPEIYSNILEIGENTGRLDHVFFDLARHFKRIDDLTKNVRKAMIYPIAVLLVLITVAVFFLVKLFPTMFNLLTAFKVEELPPMTTGFMWLSSFFQANLLWIFIGVFVFFLLIYILRRIKTTRYFFDWLELRLPYIRGFFLQLRMATFARYLSMLQSAGVDIIRSMDLATQSINNLILERLLKQSRQRIMEGNTLSATLRGGTLIPNMVVRMIGVGEAAGTLPEQLEFVANYYDEGLERKIDVALAVMEPMMIIILGALVLSMIIAMFQPMYGVFTDVFKLYGGGSY